MLHPASRTSGSRSDALAGLLSDDATATARHLSPTDIAQFIRLGQCRRYLRLRLHERAAGLGFLRRYGAFPQEMPPLLTRSGLAFEAMVASAVEQRYPVRDFRSGGRGGPSRPANNEAVLELARRLPAGAVSVALQPRLEVELDGWRLRGDLDLLRIERTADGRLDLLIVDMKSSRAVRTEHRLQVAFYQAMLDRLLGEAGVSGMTRTAIAYRGSAHPGAVALRPELVQLEAEQRAVAGVLLGTTDALLNIVADGDDYLAEVDDLLVGPAALVCQVAAMPFADVPFHLSARCDGCLYNAFCLKWAAEWDDLSLLPYLSASDKSVLQRAGLRTVHDLARIKDVQPVVGNSGGTLTPAAGHEATVRQIAATPPVGPRLDELIVRARRHLAMIGERLPMPALRRPAGHGSLPSVTAERNPNLVRIYIDAQHDHLHDRLYLLGALVVGCEQGAPALARRRTIVHLAEAPPADDEREERLVTAWVQDVLRAVVEVAAPDTAGEPVAPIHLIFYDRQEQQALLDGLARHLNSILGATPLFDFVTQLAAFDSPIASFLSQELRDQKLYPVLCPSLHEIASYLKFDWDAGPIPFREKFRFRLFDARGRLERAGGAPTYFTSRARYSSAIPLEYAYAAWGELAASPDSTEAIAPFQGVTPRDIVAFEGRRLAALEHIAAQFKGNDRTEQRGFRLPDLSQFDERARTLAGALHEFVTIERHVELGEWKRIRQVAPERRVLMGATLIVRYLEVDQPPEIVAANREHTRRAALRAEMAAASGGELTKEQKDQSKWDHDGLTVRLRIETDGVDCSLDEVLNLSDLRVDDQVIFYPRETVDTRLPIAERQPFTPTVRQILYGERAKLIDLDIERDAAGHAIAAHAVIEFRAVFAPKNAHGYVFRSRPNEPLVDGEYYTLDSDPNSWMAYFCERVIAELRQREAAGLTDLNVLYDRLATRPAAPIDWPDTARAGQARFLSGLRALKDAGALHGFEASKEEYIGDAGHEPIVLVQGPPGTGKSYATAFAVLARMQGALAAGQEYRVVMSCKTHAATDVLLHNILLVRDILARARDAHPDLFDRHFDERLLAMPIYRFRPRDQPPAGIIGVPVDREQPKGSPHAYNRFASEPYAVIGDAPAGIYRLIKDRFDNQLHGRGFAHCLVLDEASQMSLPEATMAAMAIRPGSQVIVVGDPRQMPPIVKHDWEREPRRTFQEFRAYESLYSALQPVASRPIKFAESFRLHADMAEFLRQGIYRHDGINYYSRRHDQLPALAIDDEFVAAVLDPAHPLVVVVHDEQHSQTRNEFEQRLLIPVLEVLVDPAQFNLDALAGIGVVVPHRAQRAAFRAAVPNLAILDGATGETVGSAIDTVERFQGGERTVIIVSATESDREYLLSSSGFLLDPRRLTVALSRAKHKMILVASRSIFGLFSPDEATFVNAQLWKRLLRVTCHRSLWQGQREGIAVEVWGNEATDAPEPSA